MQIGIRSFQSRVELNSTACPLRVGSYIYFFFPLYLCKSPCCYLLFCMYYYEVIWLSRLCPILLHVL
jgi:hypothetical protein